MERSRIQIRTQPIAKIAVASSFVFVLALAGCDSGTQEPDAPAVEGVAIEVPATPATPTAAAPTDGSINPDRFLAELPEGALAAIPSNFPDTIPVYPGAQPAIGMGSEVDGSARSGVQLLSNDAPSDVLAYYTNELRAAGWEITESDDSGPANSITATNGGAEMALFISPSVDGGSDIFVIHQK